MPPELTCPTTIAGRPAPPGSGDGRHQQRGCAWPDGAPRRRRTFPQSWRAAQRDGDLPAIRYGGAGKDVVGVCGDRAGSWSASVPPSNTRHRPSTFRWGESHRTLPAVRGARPTSCTRQPQAGREVFVSAG